MTELSTEQVFAALEAVQQHTTDPRVIEPLRLALVRLQELEAQPKPQGPTDEELLETAADAVGFEHVPTDETCLSLARAVLARWGRPAIEPVPVSKRLPGPEDVEPKVRYCWWYNYEDLAWYYCDAAHCDLTIWTHWLPFHVFPNPS